MMNFNACETKLPQHTVHETSVDVQKQSNLIDINVQALWDEGFTGKGMTAAILDTGVDDTHPALKGKVIEGKNFTADWNNDTSKYLDNNGHGTWCGGSIAGNAPNFKGVAYDAQLIVGKVLNSKGQGNYDQMKAGLRWVRDWRNKQGKPVDILSMSLGGIQNDPEIHQLLQELSQLGILVICAAGNSGDGNPNTDEVNYPASDPLTLSVGAYDGYGNVAKFSDSNKEVVVIAPGVNVVSTYLNNQYGTLSGTSMATPQVSGMALLLKQKYKTIGAYDLYNAVTKHTSPLSNVATTEQGNGLINATAVNDKATVAPNDYYMPFDQAVKYLDSPDYWMNMKSEFEAGTLKNQDFQYVPLEIRKFAQQNHDLKQKLG